MNYRVTIQPEAFMNFARLRTPCPTDGDATFLCARSDLPPIEKSEQSARCLRQIILPA